MYHLNWRPIFQNFDLLWQGILLGLGLALLSLGIGCIIGLLAAFARVHGGRKIRALATGYTEFIRNIPLLLIIYFVFYGLGLMGFHLLDNVWSFVLALSIYSGAYLAEVFRAGIMSVPEGLIEAGKAIGLPPRKTMQFVTLPVTFRIVLPSLSNTFISLFKDTSLAAAISVPELTYGAMVINTNTWRILEVYTTVAVMYLITCYVLAGLLRLLEKKYAMVR
ncbi:MAG: amino acid ABC transporter permease [Desulfobacterales bacterium]|nr:MAG: amino acid ABC transporter permease [Desulfobacterales bacterium]